MELYTHSRASCFRRCRREHYYAYELCRRPVKAAHALVFGSLYHIGQEQLWLGWQEGRKDGLEMAIAALHARWAAAEVENSELEIFDLVRIEELIRGYYFRWMKTMEKMRVVAVEREFCCEMRNPETLCPSKTWGLGGKVDAICEIDDEYFVVEHKSTTSDISPQSDYWLRLKMDGQVSTYYRGAESLPDNWAITGCLYDVAKKPMLRPYEATPEDKRKFTKDGKLYKTQREKDEEPEEFRKRIQDKILEDPNAWFQRGTVIRLDEEMREFEFDTWTTARAIRDCQLAQRRLGFHAWSRNPDACVRFNKFCPYWYVCNNEAEIDDDTQFIITQQHRELSAA
jgi:hypothetical protein